MRKSYCVLPLLVCMAAAIPPASASDQAVMTEKMKRRMSRLAVMPDTLQNAGFEESATTGVLPGWSAGVHAENSYRIESDQSQAYSGKRSLLIENTGKPEWGGVLQTIRAEHLAGKEIELSARLKMQGVTPPGFRMTLIAKQMGRELEIIDTQTHLTGNTDWQAVSLRAMLPKETTRLEILLTLVGDGRVWVDDVRIDQEAGKR